MNQIIKKPVVKIADEYIQQIITHIEVIRENQWALGDLLVFLIDNHPDAQRSDILNQVAGETRVTYSMLDDHERTSRKWPLEDRIPGVDWTIYRNAQKEDFDLIIKAADEGWNATRFKEEKYPDMVAPTRIISRMLGMMQKLAKSKTLSISVLGRVNALISEFEKLYQELDG